MNQNDRESLLMWLEINQQHGAFEGFPEDDMDFKSLKDNELVYYLEWKL